MYYFKHSSQLPTLLSSGTVSFLLLLTARLAGVPTDEAAAAAAAAAMAAAAAADEFLARRSRPRPR